MTEQPAPEVLDILACEIDARPADAPGIDAIASAVRAVERSNDAVVVTIDAASADLVERWVDAERQCCATIRWDIERAPDALRLRIGATPEQLDVLEQLFRTPTSS